MTPIRTLSEYRRSMDQIRNLKHRMWMLASQRGNLDPEVLKVSQEIDQYIVLVQHYWKKHHVDQTLTG